MPKLLSWPNRITFLRIGLLFVLVFLVYNEMIWARVFAAFLTVVVIVMDWLDGFLARRLEESSALGSVLDIAGDRMVECVIWICLAHLNLVGVWVPIVVISRDIFTDSIRNYALRFGYSGFGEHTMMRTRVGRFLTGSPIMRTSYAILKAVTFALLLLMSGLERLLQPVSGITQTWIHLGLKTGYWLAVVTAVVCLARGIPVIIEGVRLIQEKDTSGEAAPSA